MNRSKIFLSIFLISFTSLITEILLTRIFSVTLYYHFAFFVISLVMFGLSLGGTYLFIFEKNILKIPAEKVLYTIFLLVPISLLAIALITPKISFSYDFGPKAYLLVLLLFLVCQLPFFFVGFLMSYLFLHFNKESGKVYFFDLIGASAGAFLSVFLINHLEPINSLIFLGVVSSLILLLNSHHKRLKISLTVLLGFIILILVNSQFKIIKITETKGNKMTDNLFAKWNSFSMVKVAGDEKSSKPGLFGWGISSAYEGFYPPKLDMHIDGAAYTPITKFDGDLTKLEFLKYDVTSFAYHLSNIPDVLIVGPGGGRDILTALMFEGKKIVGVEVNPIITNDIMKGRFRQYSGSVYCLDNVKVIVDDARSYIRNSQEKYDIIQASLVDTWAATNAGAYSLCENNLYTVEAMAEYLGHLTANGYLTISQYDINSHKLTVMYIKAAQKLGINNAKRHIAIIKSSRIVNLIFKKSEFNDTEVNEMLQLAEKMKFEVLYVPGFKENNTYAQIINCKDLDRFIETYPDVNLKLSTIYLNPSTDDMPFFFNRVRFRSVPGVLFGKEKNVGIFLLYGLLGISLYLSLMFIAVPLYFKKKILLETDAKNKFLYLAYFSLLGMAFMIIEVSFLQKFMLFLGYPIYSIMVVISSILFFAGLGSFLTTKISQDKLKPRLKTILLMITGIILCYNLSLYLLFNKLLGVGIGTRIIISIFMLGIMGIFIGMPFPIGMKLLGLKHNELIPFCWSLNGVFSVLGSIFAVILAMNIGFTKTIYFATSLYLIVFMLAGLIKTES